jgi:hypothetical protein
VSPWKGSGCGTESDAVGAPAGTAAFRRQRAADDHRRSRHTVLLASALRMGLSAPCRARLDPIRKAHRRRLYRGVQRQASRSTTERQPFLFDRRREKQERGLAPRLQYASNRNSPGRLALASSCSGQVSGTKKPQVPSCERTLTDAKRDHGQVPELCVSLGAVRGRTARLYSTILTWYGTVV